MAYPKMKKFATLRGWEIVKNSAYGEENGYLFSLIDGPGFKTFATSLPQISEENKDLVLEYLKNNKKSLKISTFDFDNNVLLVTFKESLSSVKIEVMNNYIEMITNYLSNLNIKSKGHCILCGGGGAAQTIYIDGIIYSAHDDCYNREIKVIDDSASEIEATDDSAREYEMKEKNYFVGFVGAVIGGIVASIPWILVQLFFNRIAAILAIVIGMGALKGYHILKGRLGPLTRWIVGFSTIIAVVLAQFIDLGIEMMTYDIPFSFHNLITVLSVPEVLSTLRENLVMSLLLAFLGIYRLFLNLKADSKSEMTSMKKE